MPLVGVSGIVYAATKGRGAPEARNDPERRPAEAHGASLGRAACPRAAGLKMRSLPIDARETMSVEDAQVAAKRALVIFVRAGTCRPGLYSLGQPLRSGRLWRPP